MMAGRVDPDNLGEGQVDAASEKTPVPSGMKFGTQSFAFAFTLHHIDPL